MRFELKLALLDSLVEDTLKLLYGEKTKESLEKFSHICKDVLDKNDAFSAYVFAAGVSFHLDEDYQKLFNVKKFENVVLKSRDEDLIYNFGRDVKGADLKTIHDNLNSRSARDLIKHDMQTL